MLSCQKYHGVEHWEMEAEEKIPYGTQQIFLRKIKRTNIKTLCWYIFIVSRTTKTLIDHNDKITIVRRRDAKMAATTLVRSHGHLIRATRKHEIQEGTLTDQGAPSDHSGILARRANCIQSVQLNSVGGAYPPICCCIISICTGHLWTLK